MKKRRLTVRRMLSLLLTLVMLIGVLPELTLPVHAGGTYNYDINGIDMQVNYEDKWGVGEVLVACPTCGEFYSEDFEDNNAHDVAQDLIIENFFSCFDHCNNCADEYHCYVCQLCFENGAAERCSDCESPLCKDCHLPEYPCDYCGVCRLSSDGHSLSGHHITTLPDFEFLCEECIDSIEYCAGCDHNCISIRDEFFTYDAHGESWCPNCGLCHDCCEDGTSVDFGHCAFCNVCGEDEPVCDSCQLCWDCNQKRTHCPECDDCFPEGVEWCLDGGEHCIHCCEANGWLCDQCGVCVEATGGEFCGDCGLCLDCCELNSENFGCTHLYCVCSSDFEDHLCPSCGGCPDDLECEYCYLCDDCQQDYHCEHGLCPDGPDFEEHICDGCGDCYDLDELCELCRLCPDCQEHCEHDLCPEDPEYDDHFCDQCGDCYEEDEFCEECELCIYCCEENTDQMGCTHGLCVESSDFQEHYCFEDSQCLEECEHVDCQHDNRSAVWSKNESSHWRKCSDCGASVDCAAHTPGSPVVKTQPDNMAGKNGTAEISCTVCGQLLQTISVPCIEIPKDGSPYIISEPKDYSGKFSTILEDGEAHWAIMKVYAGGEGTLSYQWYDRSGQPVKEDLIAETTGTKTATLRIYVPNDACTVARGYYCVVTNAKGSAKTRTAEVRARHQYLNCKDKGTDGHVSVCCGAGCTEEYGGVRPHRYSEWTVIKQPTATASGRMSRTCQDCGRTDSKELPPVDPNHVHNYNNLKYTSERHWYACSCGLIKDEAPHSFGAWEHVRVQTVQAEGLDQRTCTVCGYKESKTLAKLTHEHDFTKLKNKDVGAFTLPNGYIEDDYHVTFCNRCTAMKREAHEYGNWHVFCYPYTDKGVYHKGVVIRTCLDCGHSESVEFTDGKWPIFTSCIDPDTEGGRWCGPYDVGGTMIANPGEKVKVTVRAHEGYIFPESVPGGVGPFGVNDVGPYDHFRIAGKDYDPANSQVKDWKYDAATQTLTFTMPDGPVGLMLYPEKCDHEGAETYTGWIRAGCTNNGEYVRRCKRCGGVKEVIYYTAPTGHAWEWLWDKDPGDCYNRSTYYAQCRVCEEVRILKGGYNHKEGYYLDGVEPTCVRSGRKNTTVCPECMQSWRGDIIPALGHEWTDWKMVQEATTTEKEKKARSCTRCGKTQTETGDYSGPDYRLKANRTKIHFDFTYGQTPEPETVKYSSVGRNPITEITSVNEVVGGVTTQEIDGLQMTVIPQPWILVQNWLDVEPEVLTACANNDWDEVVGSAVEVTANVRKTKENYTLTVEGGTAWIDGKDKRTAKDSLSIPGGEKLHIQPKSPDTFLRWEIVEDASGYLKKIFEEFSNYSSPIDYKNEEMTVWMSANDVTLRALYKGTPGLYRLTLDYNGGYTKSAEWFTGSGGTVDFLPKAGNSGYIFEGWWTAPEGGEHIDIGSVLTEDVTLYAHWRSRSEPAFPELLYTYGSRAEALCYMEVATDRMAEKNEELKKALQAGQVSYQWFRNGKMISGENGKSLDIPDDWIDGSIHTVVCFNGHQITGKPVSIGSDVYGDDGGYVAVSGTYSLSTFYGSEHETVLRTLLDLDPEMASGEDHDYFDLDQDGTNDLRVYKDYASNYYAVILPSSNLQGIYYYPVPEAIQEAMRIRGKTYYSQIKFRFPEYEDNGTYVFPLYKDKMILDPSLWDTLDYIDKYKLIACRSEASGKYYDLDDDGVWDFNEVRDLSTNTYYWQANPNNSTIADGDGYCEVVLPEKVCKEMNENGMAYYSRLLFIFSKEQADRGTYILDLSGNEVTLSTSSMDAQALRTTLQCLAQEAHNPIPEESSIGAGEVVWSVMEGLSRDFTWREDNSNMTHFARHPDTNFNGVACFRLNSDNGDFTGKVLDYGSVYYSTLYIKMGELDQGSHVIDLTGEETTIATKSPEYRTLEALATSGDIGAVWISTEDDSWSGHGYDLDKDGIIDLKIPWDGGKIELCPATRIFGEFTVPISEQALVENFFDFYGLHYNRTYYSELVFRFPELSKGSYTLDLTSEDLVLDNDEYLKQTLSKLIAPNTDWSGPVSVDLDGDGAADIGVTSSGGDTLYTALPCSNLIGKWIWTAPDKIAQKAKSTADVTGYYDSIVFVFAKTEQFTAPLEEAIAAAAAIDLTKYTAESVAALQKALADAKAALANAETMNEVIEKAKALNDAIAALKEPEGPLFRFDDVKDPAKFYYAPVYWAYEAKPQITNGADETHFAPDNACTRGHVVTFLWRAAGCPEPKSSQTPFKDLKKGAFYEKAVAWAVENEITNGISADKFGPDAKCNRGQIVTFLWRFKGKPDPKSADTPFKDLKDGAFYLKAVAWAVENEVTNGMSADKFGPDATCTRGQVVTFLYRAVK